MYQATDIVRRGRAWTYSAIAFAVLGLYKTIQHLSFNTYAYDLGIRASILYNIAFHGRVWDSLHGLHGFSGHFHPVSFLLAGLYRLWPSALHLCLLQALAVSLGLFFLIKLLELKVPDRRKQLVIVSLYLFNPFLHHVLAFDFHPEIFAVPLVLMFFYLFETDRSWLSTLPAFALLTLKEDMGLVLLALGIYALAERKWIPGAVMTIVGLCWLPFVLFLVLPVFRTSGQAELINLHYGSLGASASQIISNLLNRPWIIISNTFGQPRKLLAVALLVASVGAFALTRWEASLVIPLLLAHLLSDGPRQSSLLLQYSAGIIPLLIYASASAVRKIKLLPLCIVAALALPAIILRFPNPFKSGIDLPRTVLTHGLISRIPDNASVTVSNNLAPHLVNRPEVNLYPELVGSRYLLVDLEGNIYPASWEDRYRDFTYITSDYDTLSFIDGLVLLKRRFP